MRLSLVSRPGRLIRRYKRFLADIELPNGDGLTIHCPNTGSMLGCAEPGTWVYYSQSPNPKRKYPHTWELAKTVEEHWICINTGLPNKLVGEALKRNTISELAGYSTHQPEVNVGHKSRIDWFLTGSGKADCYIEVKNVTLLQAGQGYFPDAVSARATKHLQELLHLREQGCRAVLLFVVSHSGIDSVAAAAHIDPAYAAMLGKAVAGGVEVLAYAVEFAGDAIHLSHKLPVHSAADQADSPAAAGKTKY